MQRKRGNSQTDQLFSLSASIYSCLYVKMSGAIGSGNNNSIFSPPSFKVELSLRREEGGKDKRAPFLQQLTIVKKARSLPLSKVAGLTPAFDFLI